MTHRIPTVLENHIKKTRINFTLPNRPSSPSTRASVMSQSTSDSCACASDSAQRRRYEAVCEMQPRQNSIVWITWWITTSLKSCCSYDRDEPWNPKQCKLPV